MSNQSDEETSEPLIAAYYKVEKWTKDGSKVDRMLYASNNLDRAHVLFEIKRRPRIRLTIRQRTLRAGRMAGENEKALASFRSLARAKSVPTVGTGWAKRWLPETASAKTITAR
jgi:hypothetical protein